MTNEDDESDSYQSLPEDAELDKRLAAAEEERRELERCGLVWRDDPLGRCPCHPDDPEINTWFDPYTGEQFLSPKLVEQLKRRIIPHDKPD
jgi:hypothetical protein